MLEPFSRFEGLTVPPVWVNLDSMQLIIDVPEKLGQQLEGEREHLPEILQLGLCRRWSNANSLWREVLTFLARGPKPGEIVQFHASEAATGRMQELLDRNRENILTAEEEAELDEMCHLDRLISSLKAEAWRHVDVAG